MKLRTVTSIAALGTAAVVAAGLAGPAGSADASVAARRATRSVDPLTGLRSGVGPLVAVKISNIPEARPQSGLTSADQVWMEEIDGGHTRFVAFYGAAAPTKIGPVRSLRETDLQILRGFGRPGIAFAGADAGVSGLLPKNRDRIVDLGKDAIRPAYYFVKYYEGSRKVRKVPNNFYLNGRKAQSRATGRGVAKPRAMGFVFGKVARIASRKATVVTVTWNKRSQAQFTWSPKARRWYLRQDKAKSFSAEGRTVVGPKNVVIMRVNEYLSRINYSSYGRVPVAKLTGRGSVTVLRDGRAYTGTWDRSSTNAPLVFHDAKGHRIALSAGQSFVLLVGTGRSTYDRTVRTVSIR